MIKPLSKCRLFRANLQHLTAMLDFIREEIEAVGFEPKIGQRVEIAVEEALVNVINHAYLECEGMIELTVTVIPDKKIFFTIKDRGIPFDPLCQEIKWEEPVMLEDYALRGLGLKLMREFIDHLHYEREGLYNILTLEKFLSLAPH